MNLGELLTELRENILHDRSDQVAGVSDRLWSDATLVRYIDEAQRRFARHGLVIRDAGTDKYYCRVKLVAGQKDYTLDTSLLAVISARYDEDLSDLARAGHAALNTFIPADTYFWDPNTISQLPPGKPLAFRTDENIALDAGGVANAITLTVYPVPSAAYADKYIYLRVVRLPLDRLTPDNLLAEPEVPEDHHLELLDWAAYLALRIVDHDLGDPARAAEFRASFEEAVKRARTMAMRRLFAPLPWGFGRNGFSWEK